MPSSLLSMAAGLLCVFGAARASLSPVFMDFAPVVLDEKSSNVTSSASYSQTLRQHHTLLSEQDHQQIGRIEVRWQFATIDLPCRGGCGPISCICPTPRDLIFFDWYANGASDPTCSDVIDITIDSLRNQVNGRFYYSKNCDILAIFDGPNPNEGAVQTYTSGHGANCGWVTSPDHTSNPGILSFAEDYYHHCSWST